MTIDEEQTTDRRADDNIVYSERDLLSVRLSACKTVTSHAIEIFGNVW